MLILLACFFRHQLLRANGGKVYNIGKLEEKAAGAEQVVVR